MENKKSFFTGILAGLFLAVVVVCATIVAQLLFMKGRGGHISAESPVISTGLSSETLNKLTIMEKLIKENYALDMVDDATLENGIYKGLVASLGDPYSAYYSQEEMIAQQDKLQGVYYGIGCSVILDEDTGYAILSEIYDNSPAQKAGLISGDMLKAVDGRDVKGMELDKIVALVRGDADTKVTLLISRVEGEGGEPRELSIDVTRGSVPRVTVNYEMLEDDIGYIRISEFDSVTVDQFTEAMATLKVKEMKGLVLDLRGNPGGNFSACVEIGRQLLPKGLVTYTETRQGQRDDYKCDGAMEIKIPLAVLVDSQSASASEILAGAIKDHKKGTLVGTTTYGKGVVQRYIGLTDGSSIKLTSSKYYTPNGENIHGIGIVPDEELKFDGELFDKEGRDNQLEKATEIVKQNIQNSAAS